MHLARFAGFSAAAIAINLMSQNTVLMLTGAAWFGIYFAIAFGNASGLVFKYICDKHWVFGDDAPIQGDGTKFGLYALSGVLTTAIFWAVELSFHYVFQTAFMTNVGAVLGLSVGYVIKYNLDKRVTFRARAPAA